jgi:uncharacterized paraquat-inducible protein A
VTSRNRIALALTIVSLVLLVPGLVRPVLTITATMELFGISRELFTQTRSIAGAIRSLHESGNDFVAGLILFFSVVVPLLKAAVAIVIFGARDVATRERLHRFVGSISKWAMADVFAVGIFIAMLAARATNNLGATLHEGFYWFAAYCLVSNLAFQFLRVEPRSSVSAGPW